MVSPVAVVHAAINNAKLSSSAAPPIKPPTASSLSMVDDLARNILRNAECQGCHEEVAALIDIATFRNSEANAPSRRAEGRLLELFAAARVSPTTQRQIIDQLFASEAILAQGDGGNTEQFAMPASLKHLMGQYVHRQVAADETDVATDAVQLEEMEQRLEEASKLNEKVIDPNRFVTTDEMSASVAQLPGTCPHIVNLSDDVDAEAAQMQMGLLLDSVPETGVVSATLLVKDHFMLIVAEKDGEPGKYALTVSNTRLPRITSADVDVVPKTASMNRKLLPHLRQKAGDRFSEQLTKRILSAAGARVSHLDMFNDDLQRHAINSCGPLVFMMVKKFAIHKPTGDGVGALIKRVTDEWRNLEPQQQKDRVLALRAEMFGHMVEWQRTALPDPDRFIDSRPILPRPDAKTEIPHL
jgi:hypothetical protein